MLPQPRKKDRNTSPSTDALDPISEKDLFQLGVANLFDPIPRSHALEHFNIGSKHFLAVSDFNDGSADGYVKIYDRTTLTITKTENLITTSS